ncbi:collagen alpha-5(VI) chain-like isoform X1 [Biomphalaria pfeifferi]|uniref:Collagen alpha-5(VI) chain-like isoform X1 n=1 Tax=Biomphalaria pfeifferi TaxID=112525 RepID=A0AAD8FEM4_BIOPF|nr:collagen alpha-5(VI) chain-like isoform X1 [Biomphalaria pfeifferi]
MIRLARVFCMFSALVVQIVRTTQGPIDLVFVLDGSSDIGDFNFKLSIQAASGYLEDANIGPNRTRVGVVVYSTEVGDYVPLMSDIPVLKSSIMNFKYPAMTRATDVGIRKAVDILTKEKRNVSRVMVIVLSGKSDNRTKTKLESELAQAKGIDIWGLGVFPYLSMTELVNLTTNGAKQAFEIENIRDFFGAFSNLPAGEINSIYTYREPVDLVFAIDVSFEIGEENFKLIQSNVLKCLGLLFIGPLDTHVGVVLSTSVSSPSIQLQSDYETIYSSVSSIKLSDRVVTTDKVLGTAVNSLLATQRKLFKAVILITDGHYINKYRNETHDEAIRAKDNNITLWGVSIDCTFPLTEDLCRISEAFYLKDLTSNIQTLEYSDTVTTNGINPVCVWGEGPRVD